MRVKMLSILPGTIVAMLMQFRSTSGQRVTCPILRPPDNTIGEVILSAITVGSQARYSCFPGYMLTAPDRRMCQANGTWSGEEPLCTPIDCGLLKNPDSGNVMFDSTIFRSEAVYTCDEGHFLVGNNTRMCLVNRSWSGSEPHCERVDCGPLPNPGNGMVTHTSTNFQSGATYNCFGGFVLAGMGNRTCGADGEWSGAEPVCQDINECSLGTDSCDLHASCFNSKGSFTCTCRLGFTGNGVSCLDVDECLTGSGNNCHEEANCLNNQGSYLCTCRIGFFGNGMECDELCVIQLVLDGIIGDCNQWILLNTEEMVAAIDSFVQSTIAGGCGCNFTADNVIGGLFRCQEELPSTAVVYQAGLRGVDGVSCNELERTIKSGQSLRVLGRQLELIRTCDISMASANSDFLCNVPEDQSGDGSGAESREIGIIAGAAGGGALLVLVCLVSLVVLLVFRRRQWKRRINAASGRTLRLQLSGASLVPNDHIYTTAPNFQCPEPIPIPSR